MSGVGLLVRSAALSRSGDPYGNWLTLNAEHLGTTAPFFDAVGIPQSGFGSLAERRALLTIMWERKERSPCLMILLTQL